MNGSVKLVDWMSEEKRRESQPQDPGSKTEPGTPSRKSRERGHPCKNRRDGPPSSVLAVLGAWD
jgi:hypothetical protein